MANDQDEGYNVHRWYRPGTGRYTRPDPFLAGPVDRAFLEEGYQSLYAYANNLPIVLVDPLGLLALPTGTDCENFNDIIQGLEDLTGSLEDPKRRPGGSLPGKRPVNPASQPALSRARCASRLAGGRSGARQPRRGALGLAHGRQLQPGA